MHVVDLLIEAEPADLDWYGDPTELGRALARRLMEIDPALDHARMPDNEKLARARLPQEFERVIQH
jgi:hypothetical protein